jgi:hypothetical protein
LGSTAPEHVDEYVPTSEPPLVEDPDVALVEHVAGALREATVSPLTNPV